MKFAGKFIDVKTIILSNVIQIQKNKHFLFSLYGNIRFQALDKVCFIQIIHIDWVAVKIQGERVFSKQWKIGYSVENNKGEGERR